jgi:hypothetical protein
MLKKVDYISCVSGGACAAASFFSHVASCSLKPDVECDAGRDLANESEIFFPEATRSSSPCHMHMLSVLIIVQTREHADNDLTNTTTTHVQACFAYSRHFFHF